MSSVAERRRARRLRWAVAALFVIAAAAGVAFWLTRPARVAVVHPRARPVVESIAATGRVYGAQEALVAPEEPGRLETLLVDEGDRVSRGQAVARLQSDVTQAELKQAQAAVATAQAQLREAQAGPRASEIEQARAETQAAVADAQGRLERAQDRLRELQAGGTSAQRQEVIAQVREAEARVAQARREVSQAEALSQSNATARAAVEQARAGLREAEARVGRIRVIVNERQRDLARAQRLYRVGAIPRVQQDSAAEAVDTARQELQQAIAQREQAQVEVQRQQRLLEVTRRTELQRTQANLRVAQQNLVAARARLRNISEPARPEVIAQQRAEVAAAQEALAQTREAGRARLQTLLSGPRSEAIAVASRRLQETYRARDAAQARLRRAQVDAPFGGVITEVLSRPGAAVGPGQPILRLTEIQVPEVRVDVDERNLARIRVGQPAVLVADAFPNQPVDGRVTRIGPRADPLGGTVTIVIAPRTVPAWLRSGLTVDANIIVAQRQRRLVVPTTAIIRRGDRTLVLVVEKGVVRERRVVLGEGGTGGTVVLSGLQPTDWVVVQSTSARPGQRARPQPA